MRRWLAAELRVMVLLQTLTPTSVSPSARIAPQSLRAHSFPIVGTLVAGARRRAWLAAFVFFRDVGRAFLVTHRFCAFLLTPTKWAAVVSCPCTNACALVCGG